MPSMQAGMTALRQENAALKEQMATMMNGKDNDGQTDVDRPKKMMRIDTETEQWTKKAKISERIAEVKKRRGDDEWHERLHDGARNTEIFML